MVPSYKLVTTHFKLDAEVITPDTNDDNAALLSPGLRYFLYIKNNMVKNG